MSAHSHAGVRRAFRMVGDQLEAVAGSDAGQALLQLAAELPAWQSRQLQPCAVPGCGRPGRLMPRGRRCELHRPPAPAGTYCAPGRCYCAGDSCERQAS